VHATLSSVAKRPRFSRDASRGAPCEPREVLRLVVEGAIEGATLPEHVGVGTVFDVAVTPFWIGLNAGCFQGRPNDLILDGAGLSRNSCCFVLRDGRWYGHDDAGTTPLRINGSVARWTAVSDGDVIDLGRVRCRARVEGGPP
jgi:hypothetical protein